MYNFQCTILTRATHGELLVMTILRMFLLPMRRVWVVNGVHIQVYTGEIYRLPDRLLILDYCCCPTCSESLKHRERILVFVASTLDRWAINGKVTTKVSERVKKYINVETRLVSLKPNGKTILNFFVRYPFWKPYLLDIMEEQWCTIIGRIRDTSVFEVFAACTLRCGVNFFVPSTCCCR